jgi:hypothetical protein
MVRNLFMVCGGGCLILQRACNIRFGFKYIMLKRRGKGWQAARSGVIPFGDEKSQTHVTNGHYHTRANDCIRVVIPTKHLSWNPISDTVTPRES